MTIDDLFEIAAKIFIERGCRGTPLGRGYDLGHISARLSHSALENDRGGVAYYDFVSLPCPGDESVKVVGGFLARDVDHSHVEIIPERESGVVEIAPVKASSM
jgi:hypothetical protein